MSINRRTALQMLLSGATVGVLAACGAPTQQAAPTAAPAAKPPPAAGQPTIAVQPAATTAPKPAAGPRPGGQLRSGQLGDIVTLDPHFLQPSSESVWLSYDRLIAYDTQLKPQPMLAESWELSSDAKQLKVNLRKGVTFHTGREFTSEDVKYSITRAQDPKIGVGQYATQARWFQSIETPDKYTAILVADQPRPLVFDFLEYLNMVDKDTLEGPDAKTKSIGTGPYTFVEWIQGDHATYAKNKNYWQPGKPYLDEIRVVFLGDAQAMMVQLETGALDVVRNPLRQDFARLRDNPKFQAIAHPANSSAHLFGAATYAPPTDNKQVRQALNLAIDRKRIVDTLLLGVGTAQSLPWSDGSPAYEAAKMQHYTFDLDKAKALLAQAGASDLSVDIIPNPGNPEGSDVAQLYQADLAKIGVKLNIIKLDMAVWSDQVNGRKYKGLYYASSINLQLSPGTAYTGRPLNPDDNNEGFRTDTYASLVSQALSEPDQAKLKQIYSQVNDIILDESFVMYVTPNVITMLARAGVNDITPHMHGGWLLTDTWLAA